MEGSQVGRGHIMEGLVARAKEAGFYSQCNANSSEGLSGWKRSPCLICAGWIEAGKSLGHKVVGRSWRGRQKPHQTGPWRMGLGLCT